MTRKKLLMRGPIEAISLHPMSLYIRWRQGKPCHHCRRPPDKIREPYECFACGFILDFLENRDELEREAVRQAELTNNQMVDLYDAVWARRATGTPSTMSAAEASIISSNGRDCQSRMMLILTEARHGDPFEKGTLANRAWVAIETLGSTCHYLVTASTDEKKPAWGPQRIAEADAQQ